MVEKIYLKPSSKEIISRGDAKEGHMDVFSYSADSEEAGKLGNLYIVGNVHHASDDSSYIINLVASLARREYYEHTNLTPREAFAGTLKKVNEVVEEFFKTKDLKMHVGIFAIAGENIYISKLSKFKIILSRDGRNVDILNNIELFDKQYIEEKEFSSIISGKVKPGDRILAFYPSRSITTREKSVKESFLKLDTVQFEEKIDSIKKSKPGFECALVCINLTEEKEILTPVIKKKVVAHKPEPKLVAPEMPQIPEEPSPEPQLASSESRRSALMNKIAEARRLATMKTQQFRPAPQPIEPVEEVDEIPHIIPAEFSTGTKNNFFKSLARLINYARSNTRLQAALLLITITVLTGSALTIKTIFFQSAETKELNQAISDAQTNLKVAKTKISQNEVIEARQILLASLNSVSAFNSDKVNDTKKELIDNLDTLDKTTEASPTLIYSIPSDILNSRLITATGNKIYILADKLLEIVSGNLDHQYDISNVSADTLFSNESYVAAMDTRKGTMFVLKDGKSSTNANLSLNSPIDIALYQGNAYIMALDGISRVTDAINGGSKLSPWLSNDTLPQDPKFIVVDGNVFVMNANGTLITYYKGQRKSEVNTLLTPGNDDLFLTSADSASIYLVNKNLGRIYRIDKLTGKHLDTTKLNSDLKIISASVDNKDLLYLLTSDNKVWSVQF